MRCPGHRTALAAAYGAGALALASAAPPAVATAAISTVWASFVASISFTEAWVKFQAPTLDTAAAVDAGRHVFAALNAVEGGLAVGLAASLAHGGMSRQAQALAAAPLAVLVADVLVLTPCLDKRARHRIAASALPGGSAKRVAAVRAIQASGAGAEPPPAALHAVYVVGEAVKLGALAVLAAQAAGAAVRGEGL